MADRQSGGSEGRIDDSLCQFDLVQSPRAAWLNGQSDPPNKREDLREQLIQQ